MKCRRVTCDNDKAREVTLPELGTMVLGCSHTPVSGSRFCFDCKEAASRGLACVPCEEDDAATAALCGSDMPATSAASTSAASTVSPTGIADAAGAGSSTGAFSSGATDDDDAIDGEASLPEPDSAPVAADEWLVECLQDSRKALKCNEGSTCRSQRVKVCMRNRHTEYLVKFVGYDNPS